jgi:RNA-binding protein Nova
MMARDGKSTQLRLLVPAALCGAVIGKGGATIRGFAEDSKAAITVSSQDKQPPGVLDRVVRVTGGPEQLLRAVALLLTKLAENPNYARFTSATVSYAAPAAGPAAAAPLMGSLPAVPSGSAGAKGQQRVEVTVPVPEGRVGAVIGKGGEVRALLCGQARCRDPRGLTEAAARPAQVISQLKSVVGVKIRISDREDFVPGTRNRKVTISGTADAVQIAQVRSACGPRTRTPVSVPARPQVAARARPPPALWLLWLAG